MNKIVSALIFVVFFFLITPVSAHAATLLIREEAAGANHGYNKSSWSNYTDALNNKYGLSNITVVSDFDSTDLNSYDALFVEIGDNGSDYSLSGTEVTKIQNFIQTGKRVVMIGEVSSFNGWNASILSVVDDTFKGNANISTYTPVYSHQLTSGVTELSNGSSGESNALGGTVLFNRNVAVLYGESLNTLVVMDTSFFSNASWGLSDNSVFVQNVIDWLYTSAVPSVSQSSSNVYQHPSTTNTPSCNDSKPAKAPDLFEVKAMGTRATLHFTTVPEGTTGYSVNYGLDDKAEQFGDNFSHTGPQWILDRTIHNLVPGVTYFFKVRANNGCNAGDWSKTGKIKI